MPTQLGRLIKGTSIYSIGALFPKALGVILIPIYSRYLTREDYGILAMVATIHSVLYILMEAGLGHAVLRFYFDFRDDKEAFRRYLGSIQLFLFGANLAVVGALFIFGESLFSFLIKDPSLTFQPYIWYGILTTYLALGSIVPLEVFRAREQPGRYVAFQMAYFLAMAGAIIYYVVVLRQGALGSIKGRLIITGIFCLIYWVMFFKQIRLTVVRRYLYPSLAYGLPLVPMAVANWVLTFSDRVLIERFLTLQDVGIYAMGYTVGMVMGDVVRSINKAYVPYFFDTAKNEPGKAPGILARISLIYLVAVSAIGLFGILFCREGVLILVAEKFQSCMQVVPFVILGYFIRGLQYMTINPLYYLKRTKVLSLMMVVAAVLSVGLNLWWIPLWGIMGAAYSTVVAYLVTFVLIFIYTQRLYPIPYDYPKIALLLVLFLALSAAGVWPAWEGILLPVAVKALLLFAYPAGLLLFGVIKISDLKSLLPGAVDKGV